MLNNTLTIPISRQLRSGWPGAILATAVCLLSACGPAVPSAARVADSGGKGVSASQTQNTESGGLNRCALLTDDEVRNAIGPHGPGTSDLNNLWGLQSCRWIATTAQKAEGFPNGWFDLVEVAVFDSLRTSWARGQAKGEPVKGLIDGALYDNSYGDLWFNCGHDRFCVVKARTASANNREQIALQLAKLIEKRLR